MRDVSAPLFSPQLRRKPQLPQVFGKPKQVKKEKVKKEKVFEINELQSPKAKLFSPRGKKLTEAKSTKKLTYQIPSLKNKEIE